MADNTAITAGSGTSIATDDISSVFYQRIKLVHGADGVNDGDVSNTNPLPVSSRQPQTWFDIDVPGVANGVAYAAGDQFGTLITITNAARAAGGGGFLNSILYYDDDDQQGAVDFMFFHDSVTMTGGDNVAFAVSDTDARKILFMANMTYVVDLGANRFGQLAGISVPYFCTGTSLYVGLIARTTPTMTGGATGQHVRFALTRD